MDWKTLSNIGRFKDIIMVLWKYGFEDLVEELNVPGKLLVRAMTPQQQYGKFERFRHALEELGPAFIKLGQVLSLRPDVVPRAIMLELQKLQDDVAPVDFDQIRPVIEEGLGRPLSEVFPVFDPEPIASASLAQVYRAALHKEGPAVAVKVQRPGIKPMIKTDLEIMIAIADKVHERFDELKIYELPQAFRSAGQTMMRELDFRKESRYMHVARANLSNLPFIYIPKVYDEYCTEQILVMEQIIGTKIRNIDRKHLDKEEAYELARQGLKAGVQQVFRDGFFHADPHPGNLIIGEDNKICLIDWGMVGRLTSSERHDLIDLVSAVADKDSKRLMYAVLSIAILNQEDDVNRRSLEKDLMDILDMYHSVSVEELNLGQLLLDIVTVMRDHYLSIPPDFATMIKTLITLEGVARQLYPELDVIDEAAPYIKRLSSKRFTPSAMFRGAAVLFYKLLTSKGHFPRHIGNIVRKIDEGTFRIQFALPDIKNIIQTLEHVFNRLTFGIIIGSLIIGSSMIITTGVRPHIFGYPAFGIIGYIVSALLGLWLIYHIIRHRNF